ncbi:MAG TPA: hypothetical protein VGM09_04495 [Bradyrhizobium sp.]
MSVTSATVASAPGDLIQRLEAVDIERTGKALAAERGSQWRPICPGHPVIARTRITSGDCTMQPVGELTDVLSFGARRAVNEIGNTLQGQIWQRRNQLLFCKACVEQIFRSDDGSQSVANRVHGHE